MESLYQETIEGISDAFISVDFDWHILYLNNKTAIGSTLGRDEIVGNSLWEAFPMLVDLPLHDFYRRCMESSQADEMEHFSEVSNRWHHIRTVPTTRGLNIFISDITDTKKIAEGQDQFQIMANSIPQLGWMADRDGNIHWYNDRWYEYTGTTLEEMAGWGWQKVHHPQHVDRVMEITTKSWQQNEPWELTFPLRGHDGNYRWFLTRIYPVKDNAGNVERWIGTNTDIHDQVKSEEVLKQSEAQLRQLSNSMPQLVWTTNATGYHDFYNDRWYEFTGLTFQETKDTGWARLLHPADADSAWQVWNHSLQTGERYETEYRMKRADGVYRWLLARATPLTNEADEIVRWFGTCTDINDQKLANDTLERKVLERTEALQEANEHLSRMNEELQQFNYVASHDLQEPLRKIKIFTERIQAQDAGNLSVDSGQFLDRVMASVDRMSNLLKDLLNFSSVNRDDLLVDVDLNEILFEIERDLELLIAQKSVTIHKDSLPIIKAIPLQMHQLLYNLVNNAIKFTPPDRLPDLRIGRQAVNRQEIKVWALDVHRTYLHLTVQDNGIGFETEFSEKIFELFKRLHGQQAYQGTGVGLALCKKVVENHEGKIWAESSLGEGTVFHVVLPIR